jgi:EAL domain-containing protein (putative c-di-GMP-specific phosphodiesterase class I)/GGDEF domain-containing protein
MYILHYDFVALLLNVINLAVFIYLKNLRDPKSGILFAMLLNSLLATTLDILSSIAIGHPELYTYRYTFTITNLYYVMNNNKIFIYVFYVLLLTGVERQLTLKQKYLIVLPFIVTTVMVLANPLNHYLFYIDPDLTYHRKPGLLVLYIISFVYLLYGSFSTIRRKKQMDRITYRALATFIVIYVLALVLQTAYPTYLLQGFATSICELIMIMILQNRNEVVDGTTKLYNQTAFYDKLQGMISNNTPFSITLIMLEDAKRISYSLGYGYLNLITQEVSGFIKSALTSNEKFYIRNGCFVLLNMKHHDKLYFETKDKLTNRFRKNWHINDLSINLTATICQLKFPEQISTYSEIYDYIDHLITTPSAVMKAEQIRVHEISVSNRMREQQVRKAIALAMLNQTFEVYYQPIYSVKDQSFISAEALVRLRDPQLGNIPPDEFIPLAERDGTITKLGMQIFEMVCSFLKHSELHKIGIRYIEVNLSVVQCMQSNLIEQLYALMKKYKIRPDQICLEITETVAVNTPEVVRRLFQELDQQGMSFALDDYGSGYSNVNYILELPFNYVKLDKSIVWDYFKNDFGKISLESTIAMMKSLNIELIAEGVETKEQADTLARLGVNYLQGYYFSKPIPSEEFTALIADKNAEKAMQVKLS